MECSRERPPAFRPTKKIPLGRSSTEKFSQFPPVIPTLEVPYRSLPCPRLVLAERYQAGSRARRTATRESRMGLRAEECDGTIRARF